jgi:hypothetical protein
VFKKTKKPIKPIKILKKPTGSVRFWFFKLGTGRTEWKKTEPNRKNRAKLVEPVFALKKPSRNQSV